MTIKQLSTVPCFSAFDLVTPPEQVKHFLLPTARAKFSRPVRVHLLWVDGLAWVRDGGEVYPVDPVNLHRAKEARS